jgi:hypothetical protein
VEPQKNFQLGLPEAEIRKLGDRVMSDYRAALGDHNRRMNRFREYYRRWRAIPDQSVIGEEETSNFPVPFIEWNVLAKLAKEADSIFGDDAEIVAVPVGPSDQRKVKKIGRYMTWRVFNSMKITRELLEFVLRKILFGRSHAYAPYKRDVYDGPDGEEIVEYEGPDFQPQWPDDVIVQAEEVKNIHQFSFVIRRYRVTPEELLQGEEEGRYQGITENFQRIVTQAKNGMRREFEGEEVKLEADEAEGILYQRPLSSGENLMVLEWYGRWRMPKDNSADAGSPDEMDFKRRDMRETELVIRLLPDLNLVIAVQNLADLYPGKKDKRPFVEASLIPDGRYWAKGICEMACDLEDEIRVNHNQATEAAALSVNPPLGYRPASGFEPKQFRVEAGTSIPLDNPQTDIKQLTIGTNIEIVQWKEQTCLAYGERLLGVTDSAMGRASDRPNTPRTATGQRDLLMEGNVRQALEYKLLATDLSDVLRHFWELDYLFTPQRIFFRVTEEDADGLFEVKDGGSWMAKEDRDGRYDFTLKFATSVYSREAEKERTLARYQIDIQNPLIVQNPRALWKVTNDVHSALGDDQFASIIPEPPEPDLPVDPREEWNRLLQGEEITVNPQDNDELHAIRHFKDIKAAEADPEADKDALRKLVIHYVQTIEQLQQKKIVQALTEQAMGAIAKLGAAGALPPGVQQAMATFPGLGMPGGNPQGQPAQPFQPPQPGGSGA